MNTSLTKFAKEINVAKSTLYDRARELGLDTSKGLSEDAQTLLRAEFDVAPAVDAETIPDSAIEITGMPQDKGIQLFSNGQDTSSKMSAQKLGIRERIDTQNLLAGITQIRSQLKYAGSILDEQESLEFEELELIANETESLEREIAELERKATIQEARRPMLARERAEKMGKLNHLLDRKERLIGA